MRIHLSGRAARVLLTLGLAAVVATTALAAPVTPTLMQAIFGDDYDPGAGSALAVVKQEGADRWFLMTLAGSAEMADGRTVVAVNGRPSSEDGADAASHGSTGMLNLYALRRVGTEWEVVERHENVAGLGSWGYFGSVEWVSLGAGKPGFIVYSGSSGQGYEYIDASVFELGKDVRLLGSFPKGSNSGGACVPGVEKCWAVDGRIRFADSPQGGTYRDILVDFTGKHYTVTEGKDGNDVEHLKASVRQTARYRFDGKAYVLVAGSNPVPD
jgi:hypothetical protein